MGDIVALPATGAPLLGTLVCAFLGGIGSDNTKCAYSIACLGTSVITMSISIVAGIFRI
ncbi:hypothetical protein ACFXKD_00130 [Nocardiopsis aegyptia]|uniref:hypothetical protein n=1 Tax=Nocardiopsis aegyptia TaxID=220378 RepID=UPI0036701345